MPRLEHIVSVTDLDRLRNESTTRIVDCRFSLLEPEKGREDYREGHIPGAVYAHLDEDLAAAPTATSGRHPLPDPDAFIETLRRLGISNDSRVVAYDDGSGGVATRLWWMLRWLGHDQAAVLDGGFAAWLALGMPVSRQEPALQRGDFTGRPDNRMAITTAELQTRQTGSERYVLVDARDARRFRGESEPIDPVAGHIPGAVNLPFNASLDESGSWKSATELRELWADAVPDAGAGEWAVMCGSGVTACHLVLSALRAGLSEPRLYAGSWSEWIRDEDRPVTGEKS
jgi:thiosulfate/3-mercaptopyruvate sulfurtransferase